MTEISKILSYQLVRYKSFSMYHSNAISYDNSETITDGPQVSEILSIDCISFNPSTHA